MRSMLMCLNYSARDPAQRTCNVDKERSRRGQEEEGGEEGKGEEERKHLKLPYDPNYPFHL